MNVPISTLPSPAPPTVVAGDVTRAREVAEAFESFFLSQVLKHMSSGLKVQQHHQ